jgi:alpha-ketoglutarate-dependent taurine dioxygenase
MSILNNLDEYKRWRDGKLANASTKIESYLIEISNPFELACSEKDRIKILCQQNNFALFNIEQQNNYPQAIIAINKQLGLTDYDPHLYAQDQGLAHITQSVKKDQTEFIPYTDKAIGWHTDGYYNTIAQRIRAFSLFCVTPANRGGENQWIDQKMVYLQLRESNPDVAKALTHIHAMSIPEHVVNGVVRRKTSIGAIFFIDEPSSQLYMRYTQRKKNIKFLDSQEVKQAVTVLDAHLSVTTEYHFSHTMTANQGILCNNILHKRSGFIDNPLNPRLLLRGRYFNRLN